MKEEVQTERTIVAVLYNIRSLHNIGSMFRTADAGGVSHMYLCGYTASPVDRFGRKVKEIAKTALGAEEDVLWTQHPDVVPLLSMLKKDGFQIVMFESGSEKGVLYDTVSYKEKIAVVVGNELGGIPEEMLTDADVIAEIPLRGSKESLNVAVAFGVAVYGVRGAP